jgi:DNA-directed RNA polymerase specialized sigma24 family protein
MAVSPTLADVPLDRSTTKELQRVAKRMGELMTERDRLILKARLEGASLRDIGNLLGVNHVTVKNILNKIEDDNLIVMSTEELARW